MIQIRQVNHKMKFIITMNAHVFFYIWLSTLTTNKASRILGIFPVAGKSHFSFHESLMRSLLSAGHRITIVTPFAGEECLKNYTVIDSNVDNFVYIGKYAIHDSFNKPIPKSIRQLTEIDENYCHNILKLGEIQSILNSDEMQFDVMFVELFCMYECYLPMAEKMGIPVIGAVAQRSWKFVDPFTTNSLNPSVGNPYNPALVPYDLGTWSNIMTFYQRLQNTLYCVYADFYRFFVIGSKVDKIYHQYYSAQHWHKKKISLVFYNSHFTFLPKPSVPNAIEAGGVHLKAADPLPQIIQKFIEESKHGVILFTFGSVIKCATMAPEMVTVFKEAFAEIPQRVIWKFEEEIDDLPNNVLILNWVPQRDILAHANVKAFVSHCGISAVYEAIQEGKPLVLAPLFGDQPSNAAILEELGVGVYLHVPSVTKQSVLQALNKIINDSSYRSNMQELSRRFKDRPMTPQQSIVYWTEYVIRHNGASHLRTTASDMPLYQYLLLDVIVFITIMILVIIHGVYFLLKRFFAVVHKDNE